MPTDKFLKQKESIYNVESHKSNFQDIRKMLNQGHGSPCTLNVIIFIVLDPLEYKSDMAQGLWAHLCSQTHAHIQIHTLHIIKKFKNLNKKIAMKMYLAGPNIIFLIEWMSSEETEGELGKYKKPGVHRRKFT